MNAFLESHFKKMYVMDYEYNINQFNNINKNRLTFKILDETSSLDFINSDNVPIQWIVQNYPGQVVGAYLNDKPVAFGSVVYKGNTGDYYKVKHSDIYLQKLYTFKEYRGLGIMKDLISYCLNLPFKNNNTDKKIKASLCVRLDNTSAIRCYEKFGFKISGKNFFIRIKKDIVFPRGTI